LSDDQRGRLQPVAPTANYAAGEPVHLHYVVQRVQVTIDPELAAALAEFGGRSRSRAVRDLAVRGAQALRDDRRRHEEAIEFLRRIDSGEDDRFDFSVSAELHAARR
jgi:hypothetical protein